MMASDGINELTKRVEVDVDCADGPLE